MLQWFLYQASIVAWSRHIAIPLDGPVDGNGFYGGLFQSVTGYSQCWFTSQEYSPPWLHINTHYKWTHSHQCFFFSKFEMWKFWRILPPKIAKLVEITLEKRTFPKFPRFLGQKKKKFAPNWIDEASRFCRLKESEKGWYRQAQSFCDDGLLHIALNFKKSRSIWLNLNHVHH